MDCDMCGREQAVLKASVEGSVMSLCDGCSKFGKVVGRLQSAITVKKKEEKTVAVAEDETEFVVANFGQLLKQKREELGKKMEDSFMKLEDFAKMISVKESVLHKMETGTYKPNVEEARRIGKLFGLKLVEKVEEVESLVPEPKKDQLTLGDMIKIKKK